MSDGKYDFFVSYNSQDRDVVAGLVELLRSGGLSVWSDLELVVGESYTRAVDAVIRDCRAVLVCVGGHRLSEFVLAEIDMARQRLQTIVPVLLPSAEELPDPLRRYQAIDLRAPDAEAQLLRLIRSFAGSSASPPAVRPVSSRPPAPQRPAPGPPPPAASAAAATSAPSEEEAVGRATDILRGQVANVLDIVSLANQLKRMKRFGYARQLFAKARAIPATLPPGLDRKFLGQQHALCTYKDTHLPADTRYDQALSILSEVDDLLRTKHQETLGLAGAIYKYKWEAFGQKVDLERSASYYTRGYYEGVTKDLGYTAINAAFVLDILAFQELEQASKAGATSEAASRRRQMAREIRDTIIRELPALSGNSDGQGLEANWWYLVTVAEAYFGLGDDTNAANWIQRARATSPDTWQIESTLRQFASIAHLRDSQSLEIRRPDATIPGWAVLAALAGPDNAKGIQTALIGKVGLALSGGGFRASLFHIGVLARLAELDALRHIEVISCVSGGSIVGAQYYLELQHLLQTKNDGDITRDDYIALVHRVSRDFLRGVQTNIRTRVVTSFWANLQMVFRWRGYSRTDRVAELCDEKLLSRAGDGKANRMMSDLIVRPAGADANFSPSTHNWTRAAKVPIIVFNATTLNTGHNWQFTATYMGEPPTGIDSEIDGNYRLRRMYYTEAPPRYRQFPLARAVASSACVPGLFEPVPLIGLYERPPQKNIDVHLVDGGVQDNQGIGALLDEGCSVLLVSDASGQMASDDEPGNDAFSSLVRSGSIAGSRVREAEYRDIAARRRSSLLRGLMFIHLKKGLDTVPIDWIGCEDPIGASVPTQTLTPYGIRQDIQELLAGIRTDLDSFHDVEAYALMTSGYRMTEYEFDRSITGFPAVPSVSVRWPFLAVEPPMKRVAGVDQAHEDLKKLLAVSHSRGLKIFMLSAPLKIAGWTAIGLATMALLYVAFLGPELALRVTLRAVAVAGLFAAVGAIVGKTLVRVVRFEQTLRQIATGIVLSLTGWLVGGLHLLFLDKLYLKRGRVPDQESMLTRHTAPPPR